MKLNSLSPWTNFHDWCLKGRHYSYYCQQRCKTYVVITRNAVTTHVYASSFLRFSCAFSLTASACATSAAAMDSLSCCIDASLAVSLLRLSFVLLLLLLLLLD